MNRVARFAALLALTLLGCRSKTVLTGSIIEVTVESSGQLSGIYHLDVHVTNNGQPAQPVTFKPGGPIDIPPAQLLVLGIPPERSGPVTVEVVAFGDANTELARASKTITIIAGGSVPLTVTLPGPVGGDGGVSPDLIPGEVTSAHGNFYKFVSSKIRVPLSSAEWRFDLNGDGKGDNQFGSIIAALSSQGFDFQGANDAAIAAGETLILFSVQTADPSLSQDDQVGVTLQGALNQPNPNFTGTGNFSPDPMSTPATLYGRLNGGSFSSNNPAVTTHPVSFNLRVSLLGWPFDLPINGAYIKFDASSSGLASGEIHGSIRNTDVQGRVIPALAYAFNAMVMNDPNSSSSMQIKQTFDVGDGNANPCTNPDATISTPMDGAIGVCELLMSSLIQSLFAPDLDIYDSNDMYAPNPSNTDRESLSIGFGFSAVGATF